MTESTVSRLMQIAVAHHEAGRLPEAEKIYREVLAADPDQPAALNSLGIVMGLRGDEPAAMQFFTRATQITPGFAEAFGNLGTALGKLGRYDEAIAALRQCIHLEPDHAQAHFNVGQILLLHGDFQHGWPEYEWRWKVKSAPRSRNFAIPQWKGGEIRGRSILLHCEQGFGDAIQFVRYVALLADRGAKVSVECPPELTRLLAGCPGVERVFAAGQPLMGFDYHCPLLSLPLISAADLNSIPANIPYLRADSAKAHEWSGRLPARQDRIRIGLAWAGRPHHKNDRNRSIPLAIFAPLGDVKGVDFYSLQKDDASTETPPPTIQLVDWTRDIRDFTDTAALIENLDLVISVDTAVAHLAGAMGKPAWTLLPYVPDWRWMLDRENSPWYPTMRLFRQKSIGDWAGVINKVAAELSKLPPA